MKKTDPDLVARAFLMKYGLVPERSLKSIDIQKKEEGVDCAVMCLLEQDLRRLMIFWLRYG